jgi:hypothetical protein
VADLPFELPDHLGERLFSVLDVEGKIPRALEALGPVGGRDLVLLDGSSALRAEQLRSLGARVVFGDASLPGFGVPAGSADVVVSFWSAFRDAMPAEVTATEQVLRPGGRLLVVHDYGRDDALHLHGDREEATRRSRPSGPFLAGGFRIRVVHCFWTFESMDDCRDFLTTAFGERGQALAAGLKRPRISYNVAIYHRTLGEEAAVAGDPLVRAATAARDGSGQETNGTARAKPSKAAGSPKGAGLAKATRPAKAAG